MQTHLERIDELKAKRAQTKQELKATLGEKAQVEGRCEQLEGDVTEMKATCEKLSKDLEEKERHIGTLEEKLKEDQQTLISNKNLIEFLNKSLNEAQKHTFRTMVNH